MAYRIGDEGRFSVRISGGFLALIAALVWFDEALGILFPALAAAIIHELGHLSAVCLLGGTVRGISLTVCGAEMRVEGGTPFSYWKDTIVAASGPLASFLCAGLGLWMRFWIFAAVSMGQGIFNLMPVGPLDGGRVLYAMIAGFGGEVWAERIVSFLSALVVGVLFGAGLLLLRKFGNPTLAITAGWLLTAIFHRKS